LLSGEDPQTVATHGRIVLSLGACASLFAVSLSAPAAAQTSLDQPYPTGFALNVFEPAPVGDRFFANPDASSYTDGRLRAGIVGDYVYGNSLERVDDVTGQKRVIVGKELYLHAGVAYPVTDFLHAHADLPFAAVQNGDSAASPKGGKFGDLRLGARANVVSPRVRAFAFGPGVDVWLPTGSPDNLTGDGRARVNVRLAASGRVGPFYYAANGGYLVRRKVNSGSLETGDAITFGAGAGLSLFDDVLDLGPEFWGNRQVSPKWNYTKIVPISGLLGAKVHLGDFVAGVAGGPGLSEAPGVAPRVIVTLALAPQTQVDVEAHAEVGAGDRDHDGVADGDDACPDRSGVASSDSTKNGCPAEKAAPLAPPDSDGDGIPDTDDACPDKLGDRSDDPKANGCPLPKIADADGDGVRDEIDACPDVKGVASSDPKTTGCPEKPAAAEAVPVAVGAPAPASADTDGDGIPDDKDACPGEPGPTSKNKRKNGCPKPAPKAKKTKAPKVAPSEVKSEVTFSGFEAFDDGSARLFVKLTREVPVEAKYEGKTVDYLLPGTRIPVRNNKNPLLTRHFGSAVVSARFVAEEAPGKRGHKGHKKKTLGDVHLVVELREALRPAHRIETQPDGSAVLVVDVPKPTTPPPPEPDEQPPAPPANPDAPPQ
jgi:hypothetical protein